MEEVLTITDGVYGFLSKNDVKKKIIGLNKKVAIEKSRSTEELSFLAKPLLAELENSRK